MPKFTPGCCVHWNMLTTLNEAFMSVRLWFGSSLQIIFNYFLRPIISHLFQNDITRNPSFKLQRHVWRFCDLSFSSPIIVLFTCLISAHSLWRFVNQCTALYHIIAAKCFTATLQRKMLTYFTILVFITVYMIYIQQILMWLMCDCPHTPCLFISCQIILTNTSNVH